MFSFLLVVEAGESDRPGPRWWGSSSEPVAGLQSYYCAHSVQRMRSVLSSTVRGRVELCAEPCVCHNSHLVLKWTGIEAGGVASWPCAYLVCIWSTPVVPNLPS